MNIESREIKIVKVDAIKPHPKNANVHSKEQIDRLAKIISYSGFRQPLVVSNLSGFLISGHGRLEAAMQLGMKEVPVIYEDFEDEAMEFQHLTADNAIASWAELDLSKINQDFLQFGPEFDVDLLGIKDFVLEPLDKAQLGDEDAVPENVQSISKLGDLYELGEHRLLCGDSTDKAALAILMGGQKADLWLTDPPYGVAYRSNGAEDKHKAIANDAMPLDEMKIFWSKVAEAAHESTSNKAPYYWFACQGGDQMMMMMALGDGGWQVKHELMWLKNTLVMGRCDYHYKHEPIIYGWKKKGTHEWFGDRKQTSVLEAKKPASSELHPTMKPIELLEPLIRNSTKPGMIVLDTFCGSGSTLIASEKNKRRCFGIELEPHYADVIVSRYVQYSGNKNIKRNGEPMEWTV